MYVLWIVVCPFVLFRLAIVLSVLLRYTESDYLPLVFSNSSYVEPVTGLDSIDHTKQHNVWLFRNLSVLAEGVLFRTCNIPNAYFKQW